MQRKLEQPVVQVVIQQDIFEQCLETGCICVITPNPALPKAGVDAGVPKAGVEGCPKAYTAQCTVSCSFRSGMIRCLTVWLTGVAAAPNTPPPVWPNGELAGCNLAFCEKKQKLL